MAEPLIHHQSARRPSAFILLACALIFLTYLIVGVQAHPVIVALVAVLISPAIWDIFRNAESKLVLDDDYLTWNSGGRGHRIALSEIERVKIRRTFDFAYRARVYLKSGKALRISEDCVPPGQSLQLALEARGITVTRALFTA